MSLTAEQKRLIVDGGELQDGFKSFFVNENGAYVMSADKKAKTPEGYEKSTRAKVQKLLEAKQPEKKKAN